MPPSLPRTPRGVDTMARVSVRQEHQVPMPCLTLAASQLTRSHAELLLAVPIVNGRFKTSQR